MWGLKNVLFDGWELESILKRKEIGLECALKRKMDRAIKCIIRYVRARKRTQKCKNVAKNFVDF